MKISELKKTGQEKEARKSKISQIKFHRLVINTNCNEHIRKRAR